MRLAADEVGDVCVQLPVNKRTATEKSQLFIMLYPEQSSLSYYPHQKDERVKLGNLLTK
jgi:hypothetical protein